MAWNYLTSMLENCTTFKTEHVCSQKSTKIKLSRYFSHCNFFFFLSIFPANNNFFRCQFLSLEFLSSCDLNCFVHCIYRNLMFKYVIKEWRVSHFIYVLCVLILFFISYNFSFFLICKSILLLISLSFTYFSISVSHPNLYRFLVLFYH